MPRSYQIGEAHIDEFCLFIGSELQDFFCTHGSSCDLRFNGSINFVSEERLRAVLCSSRFAQRPMKTSRATSKDAENALPKK
jgi:hypothetical protein